MVLTTKITHQHLRIKYFTYSNMKIVPKKGQKNAYTIST